MRQKLVSSFGFTALASGLFFIFNFTLAKILGAEEYGEIVYYVSFINIMALAIGISHPSLYMGSRIGDEEKDTFSIFFTIETLLFVLFFIPAFLIISSFIGQIHVVVLIMIIAYFLVIIFAFGLEYNSKEKVSTSILVSTLLPRVFLIVLFTLAIIIGYGIPEFYLYAYFGSTFLFFIFAMFMMRPKFYMKKKIFARAWKFYLIGVIGTSFTYIAQIMQKEYGNYAQLATLSVTLLFFAGLSLAGTVLVKFLLPKIHAYYRDGKLEKIAQIYIDNTQFILLIVLPALLVFVFNIHEIAKILGSGYEMLPEFFYILSVGYFINIVTGMTGNLLRATENEHFEIYNETGRMVFGLGLIYWLKEYQYGVAVAISVSMIIYNLMKYFEIYYLFGFVPLRKDEVLKALLPASIFIVVLYAIDHIDILQIRVVLDILAVGLVYGIIYKYIQKNPDIIKRYR
jgi:O-antigen/teichoic acid export membrane protein